MVTQTCNLKEVILKTTVALNQKQTPKYPPPQTHQLLVPVTASICNTSVTEK